VIIATHLGRPQESQKSKACPLIGWSLKATGRRVKSQKYYSVSPIAERLSELLDKRVKFVDDCIGDKVGAAVSKMKEGEILVLENLRFYKEEEENNKKFAKLLASFADIYINNAFAVSHREHASVSAIKRYLPAFAGILLEDEIINLNKVLKPEKPLIAVIGGVKIKTKISILKKFKKSASYILVGGALANNFLSARQYEIGRSLVSREDIKLTKKLLSKKVILPVDVLVSNKKDGTGKVLVRDIDKVSKSDAILDIGPQTIRLFSRYIKEAKTIIWNGPMGKFELDHFRHGTLSIARVIAARSTGTAFGVVGGGETVESLKMTKMLDYVDWVSTGGGAMLAYLGGEKMPGLKGIMK
jgi:phosphoglycerate kinase